MGRMAVAFVVQDVAVGIDHLMDRGDVIALAVLEDTITLYSPAYRESPD
jgi:hypothetical protein